MKKGCGESAVHPCIDSPLEGPRACSDFCRHTERHCFGIVVCGWTHGCTSNGLPAVIAHQELLGAAVYRRSATGMTSVLPRAPQRWWCWPCVAAGPPRQGGADIADSQTRVLVPRQGQHTSQKTPQPRRPLLEVMADPQSGQSVPARSKFKRRLTAETALGGFCHYRPRQPLRSWSPSIHRTSETEPSGEGAAFWYWTCA